MSGRNQGLSRRGMLLGGILVGVMLSCGVYGQSSQPGNQGGPGGPGGRGGPPAPGQILPPRLQDQLNLTNDQKAQVAALQAEVDKKLEGILTADQKKQLAEMRARGPGRGGPMGGGPGGGPGGPRGGPGGPMGGQSDGPPGAPPQ